MPKLSRTPVVYYYKSEYVLQIEPTSSDEKTLARTTDVPAEKLLNTS